MACSECRIRDETYAHEAAEWDAEYRRLTALVKELEAQVVAEKACRDRTYEQLSKAHARLESLELHFADEIAELEAEAIADTHAEPALCRCQDPQPVDMVIIDGLPTCTHCHLPRRTV